MIYFSKMNVEMHSFGSAIVSTDRPQHQMRLKWNYENSQGKQFSYDYEKPKEIVERDGMFHHLFYKEGYNELTSSDIGTKGDYESSPNVEINGNTISLSK